MDKSAVGNNIISWDFQTPEFYILTSEDEKDFTNVSPQNILLHQCQH